MRAAILTPRHFSMHPPLILTIGDPVRFEVNVIAPGSIVTPRFLASREIDDAMLRDGGTFDRYGNTMEVARVVEFLLGEGSSFITAQVIRVDGGLQTWPG